MLGSMSGQQGTLCIGNYRSDYVLPPLLAAVHMATNAEFLAPWSNVFCLIGWDVCGHGSSRCIFWFLI